jgi:hypothetical protein
VPRREDLARTLRSVDCVLRAIAGELLLAVSCRMLYGRVVLSTLVAFNQILGAGSAPYGLHDEGQSLSIGTHRLRLSGTRCKDGNP